MTHEARYDLCRSAEAMATASNPWLLRMDSHAPSSAGRARQRESWTCGGRRALAQRDTGQTLSDNGRERAAGRAPASLRSARFTCSIARRYYEIVVNTEYIRKTIFFYFGSIIFLLSYYLKKHESVYFKGKILVEIFLKIFERQ